MKRRTFETKIFASRGKRTMRIEMNKTDEAKEEDRLIDRT